MTTMRYRYLLVSVFLVIPAAAVAQSRADTVAVARVTVSEFGQRHPVFLDARRGFVGHLHDAGSRRADAWLASVASGQGLVGVCDPVTCTPPRPDNFRMVRLAEPRFIGSDTAQVFVVLTVGAGPHGCRDEDRIGYDVTVVRERGHWAVGTRRENVQAWVVESLCVTPPPNRP